MLSSLELLCNPSHVLRPPIGSIEKQAKCVKSHANVIALKARAR